MQKLAEEWTWVAEDIKEEGRAEGRAECYAEGYAEGYVEGYAEGLEEKAADISKKLVAEGMTVEKISAITELSAEQVNKIRGSN